MATDRQGFLLNAKTPWSLNAHEKIRSGPENAAATGNSVDPEIPEEIKRRQILLALRYVVAVRAR